MVSRLLAALLDLPLAAVSRLPGGGTTLGKLPKLLRTEMDPGSLVAILVFLLVTDLGDDDS